MELSPLLRSFQKVKDFLFFINPPYMETYTGDDASWTSGRGKRERGEGEKRA